MSDVEIIDGAPGIWFDAQDVLETWPPVVDVLINRLMERLVQAGVGSAQIGKPRTPYADRFYVAEADWFAHHARRLAPRHERWLPDGVPPELAVTARAKVVIAHQANDASGWWHVAWRRRTPSDEFADVFRRWIDRGVEVEGIDSLPDRPPDISWGTHQIARLGRVKVADGEGLVWICFSKYKPATDLHLLWYG